MVVVIDKHRYYDGDINDNVDFLECLDSLKKECISEQCLYEYFDNVVWVYKMKNDYCAYFTSFVPDNENGGAFNGFIVRDENLNDLISYVAEKGSFSKEDLLSECNI